MGKALNRRGKYSHCTRAQKQGRNKPAKKEIIMSGTKQLYSANHYHRLSFGDFGFRLLDEDATTSTPSGEHFCTVHVLKDAVVSLTSNLSVGDSSITNLDLKEGHIIYGDFTSISITNGIVICYLHR